MKEHEKEWIIGTWHTPKGIRNMGQHTITFNRDGTYTDKDGSDSYQIHWNGINRCNILTIFNRYLWLVFFDDNTMELSIPYFESFEDVATYTRVPTKKSNN